MKINKKTLQNRKRKVSLAPNQLGTIYSHLKTHGRAHITGVGVIHKTSYKNVNVYNPMEKKIQKRSYTRYLFSPAAKLKRTVK